MFHPLSRLSRRRNLPAPREDTSVDPFFRLHNEVTRLFEDAFAGFGGSPLFSGGAHFGEASPRVDVRETDRTIEIEAELPGVSEDDVNVEIIDNTLTLRGEKKHEKRDDKEGGYRYIERSYGSFSRTIPLPYDIDADAVEATFKNGVLSITLPKPEGAQRSARKIAIKRG